MKFVGFALIELLRAVGGSNDPDDIHFSYEVCIYDKFGNESKQLISLSKLDSDWGGSSFKLRMADIRHAVLAGSVAKPLTEEEFNKLLYDWIDAL